MLAGGIDKDTSLAWMICGNELFIWSYLATVAKDCLVLEVPSSLTGNKETKPFSGMQWTVCLISWHSSDGELLHQRNSTDAIICNRRTQAIAYWPDIYLENSTPVVSSFGYGGASSSDGASDCFRCNSIIAAAVPGGVHECIAIASEPAGDLWLFRCSPAEINRVKVHGNIMGHSGADHSQKSNGGRSLA
jgi:nuclear pore complex protein Nup133